MHKIALLFAILSAGALNSMEPEQLNYMSDLPKEVQVMIIQALHDTYDENLHPEDNLIHAVNAIKAMSRTNQQLNAVVNGMYGNLAAFTKLVHILADKFYRPTTLRGRKSICKSTEIVAEKFGTQVANQYIALNNELLLMTARNASLNPNRAEVINKIKELITAGADVNYASAYPLGRKVGKHYVDLSPTPLMNAIGGGNIDTAKLLLDYGAELESDQYYDTYDLWPDTCWREGRDKKAAIKQFIAEERKKRSIKEVL